MDVKQTANEGLKRELVIKVPVNVLVSKLDEKLNNIQKQAKIKGFRPGRVPINYLRRLYGKSAMSEVIEQTISEHSEKALGDDKEKIAGQPKVEVDDKEGNFDIDKIMAGTMDLDFTLSYEVMPEFELASIDDVEIVKPVVEIDDKDVDAQITSMAENNRGYKEMSKKSVAKKNDRLTLSYKGMVDGKEFAGGSSDNATLVIGSATFIPGFEDQLIGAKIDEERTLKVTFPTDYQQKDLAGQDAEFITVVKKIERPDKLPDEKSLAKDFGFDDPDKLREAIKESITKENEGYSRNVTKRSILDAIDERYSFELPEVMVSQEFDQIWQQAVNQLQQYGETFEAQGTTEQEMRKEYQAIAERRVRLGLVLNVMANENKINVEQKEMQQAFAAEMSRYPGYEKQIQEHYSKNPHLINRLRATILEDKVIDFLLQKLKTKNKKMTRKQLLEEAMG